MERFVIEGGRRLSGTVRPSGSKNEALPLLCACLLTPETVVLDNVPDILDVRVMLDILERVGVRVERPAPGRVALTASTLWTSTLDRELCRRIRASILLAGPMLARTGLVRLPPPGGDVIGRRRVDTHFLGLRELGAALELGDGYELRAEELVGCEIFLDEQSVTATENLLMAAARARGTTIVRNAACEPHVQGLCHLLRRMGAGIEGIGTNTLVVTGDRELHGAHHRVGPDYLEIGSWIGLAAATDSDIAIEDARPEEHRMILHNFRRLGVSVEVETERLRVAAGQERRVQPDLHGAVPRIDDGPWPQFPSDLMSIAITTATQCSGTVLFFEKMFESRLFFTDALIGMGASIILCDPHRVVVVGPSTLYGAKLESPDVRAGMALLVASLCARGTSVIYNVGQIDRGYEGVEDKLRGLGASIVREAV